jgi:hypothetical protein
LPARSCAFFRITLTRRDHLGAVQSAILKRITGLIECDLHHADASGRAVWSPCSSPPCPGWQPISRRRRGTFIKRGPSIRHDDRTASRLAPKRVYDRFDFGVVTNAGRVRRHLERSGRPSIEGRQFDDEGAVSGLNIITTRLRPGVIAVSNSGRLRPNDASEVMNPGPGGAGSR